MKYMAVLDTDDYEDFDFFEDGNGKYLHAVDAGATNGEWIYLPFKPLAQEPRWIPVSERLPEENVDVLVVVKFPDGKDGTLQRIEIASFGSMYHLSSEKGWITNNFTRIDRTEVIAWMPLPKEYREVEE